ncbi:MAG: hypothetical protein ACLGG0_12930 [Bacteriovoracia bacterium]
MKIILQTIGLILLLGIPFGLLPYVLNDRAQQVSALVLGALVMIGLVFRMFLRLGYEKKMAAKTTGLMFGVVYTNTLLDFAKKRNYQLSDLEFPLYILILILLLAALVPDFIWPEKKSS